jgi:hypothetical protein
MFGLIRGLRTRLFFRLVLIARLSRYIAKSGFGLCVQARQEQEGAAQHEDTPKKNQSLTGRRISFAVAIDHGAIPDS